MIPCVPLAEAICAKTGQHAVVVTGGARFDKQLAGLAQGCDMLVATPGRLIDLMERGAVDLAQVRVLVLDEADRMLDMGFWPSVRRIIAALPAKRQTLLFSATIPPSIASTVDAMLHDPARVEIAVLGETAETVEEYLCPVMQGQKVPLLKELIAAGGAVPGEKLERVLELALHRKLVGLPGKTRERLALVGDLQRKRMFQTRRHGFL